jgi:hypothetical protein
VLDGRVTGVPIGTVLFPETALKSRRRSQIRFQAPNSTEDPKGKRPGLYDGPRKEQSLRNNWQVLEVWKW